MSDIKMMNKLGLERIGVGTASEIGIGGLLPRTRTSARKWSAQFDELPDPDLENDQFGFFDVTGGVKELQRWRNEAQRASKATGKRYVTRTVAVNMDGNAIITQTVRFYRVA